ncbi:MAG: response regulator [Bacteroidota bacterium]|jgi:CheY-like chemotaxis protein
MNSTEQRPMIKKVLCVDDDALSLTISELMLNSVSFTEQIDKAMDGKDALDYLDKILEEKDMTGKAPQLILLDINMPVMNGWEFLEEFVPAYAEKLPDTKIIILSSTIDPEDFAQAKKFPVVVDFISKPLDLQMLESLKESEHFRVFFAGSDSTTNNE